MGLLIYVRGTPLTDDASAAANGDGTHRSSNSGQVGLRASVT